MRSELGDAAPTPRQRPTANGHRSRVAERKIAPFPWIGSVGRVEIVGAALARAQLLSVFELGESLQALCLDLPDPFPRQMEDVCDLFQ